MLPDPERFRFEDAERVLLDLTRTDLELDGRAQPHLLAFAGDRVVALVGVRPFGPGEALQALVELLSLLLPLDVDRLAVSLPGRAWSLQDPIAPVSDDVDLRTPVLLVILADAHHPTKAATVASTLHPFRWTDEGWELDEPYRADDPNDGEVHRALKVLLAERHELAASADAMLLAAQLGRVLLLGHDLVLEPGAMRLLGSKAGV
jgi:hypothetical protein